MDRIKERYEFIIGYVALIIALSAYKDELQKIIIDLGFVKFDLSQYLFVIILSFFGCVLFYIIPYIFSSTNLSHWRIFRIIEYASFFMFIVIALSPLFTFAIYIIKLIISAISSLPGYYSDIITKAVTAFLAGLLGFLSGFIVKRFRKEKLLKIKNEIEEEEVRDLEIAERLFKDKYYNQAILEAFKVLEAHIYKLLISKDIKISRGRFVEMFNLAFKYKLITKQDLAMMLEIRKIRNNVAHLANVEYSEEDALRLITFVKDLLKRNSNNNV